MTDGPLDRRQIEHWARSQPLFGTVDVQAEAGSSNTELVAAARSGAPDGSVLVVERQTAGRGRLDRSWTSAPYAGLTFSMLFRANGLPPSRWGWLPLLTGVSVVDAVGDLVGDVGLKWPNDVQIGAARGKAAGILAASVPGPGAALVVGVGLNVSTSDLPRGATSLAEHGAAVDRTDLLLSLLGAIQRRYLDWREARWDVHASGLRSAYLRRSTTVGAQVDVALPGRGDVLQGTALDVDDEGRLVVIESGSDARHAIAAGDVLRVRPAGTMDPRPG